MMNSKPNITTFQLTFLLIHVQVGVGLLAMPHDIFMSTGADSWIVILLTGMIIQLFIFMYGALMKRFPNNNLFGIARLLLGKNLGHAVTILISGIYILFAISVLSRFTYYLNAWMIPHTPRWVILGLICFTVVFIVKENIQVIARFSIITSIVFTGFIVTSLIVLKDATFSYLFPIGAQGVMPIIEGVPKSLYSFLGYEILALLYPFVNPVNKGIVRAATVANLFVTLFYLLLVIVSIVSFSPKEIRLIPEPVLFLIKGISFGIIERPDLLFTSMWIVLGMTSVIIIIYISTLGVATVVHKVHITYIVVAVAIISFIGSLPLTDFFKIDTITTINNRWLWPFLCGLPLFFLLISKIFNKKEEVKDT